MQIYGFLLPKDIIFNVSKKHLICYSNECNEYAQIFKVVFLNELQTRLLAYLLTNKEKVIIDKEKVLVNVWDDFGLSSSTQGLWKTINELKKKLSAIGIPENFISSIHGSGYSIMDVEIKTLLINN